MRQRLLLIALIVTCLGLNSFVFSQNANWGNQHRDSLIVGPTEILNIGSKRQLFFDEYLIAKRNKETEFRLHKPTLKEVAMVYDKPWEGSGTGWEVVFKDGDIYRMYYTAYLLTNNDGTKLGGQDLSICYAESKDGIKWVRPELGLFEFKGSKRNNIIWTKKDLDNFVPFKDPNPNCKPDEKYKATTLGKLPNKKDVLYALKSPDGIHWSYLSEKPIMTQGRFDTQNVVFWDSTRNQYWCYMRDFHDENGVSATDLATATRDIVVSTSTDFYNWSVPQRIKFGDAPDIPLYTNQVVQYYRAPHVFLGFPTQYIDRKFSKAAMQALPDPVHRQKRMKFQPRYGTVITDGLFMASHDGINFTRWEEPYLPNGPERSNNWLYGDGFPSLGLIETPAEDTTAANELSFFVEEGHWKENKVIRRATTRIDGFVSLHGSHKGGEFISKTLLFTGKNLSLNFATSASGSVYVELQDENGKPYPGFSLADCDELFGDSIDRVVTWKDKSDLSALNGKRVRVRMLLKVADIYSLIFQN